MDKIFKMSNAGGAGGSGIIIVRYPKQKAIMTKLNVTPIKDTPISKVFTFQVNMVVQILAEDEDMAKAKLDRDGGYITKRDLELLNVAVLHNETKEK